MSEALRAMITQACQVPLVRLNRVLAALGVARAVAKRPGRKAKLLPEPLVSAIKALAERYPWWGYKRIAVVARRNGLAVSNQPVYRVFQAAGLLQQKRVREAALYQAARLFDLRPQAPNEWWQTDVTYLPIPGHGWWYAVTVIDYDSRYRLAGHFTPSYSAPEVAAALDVARFEAERLHGPLAKTPFLVTDKGSSFLARRFRQPIDGQYAHVRIQYRTPTQLGLLERFHQPLKTEEVYWKLDTSHAEARESLEVFRRRYNEIRPYWVLIPPEGGDPLTPAAVYSEGRTVVLPKWQGWAKAAKQKLDALTAGAHLPMGHVPAVEQVA